MKVKRIGKPEIVHKRGDSGGATSIWSRVRKRVGVRLDSWVNLLTGLGVPGLDPGTATDFSPTVRLPDAFLEQLFNGDDLAARIVEAVPEEALREGYEIVVEPDEGDPDEATVAEAKQQAGDVRRHLEDDLHATEKLTEAWVWGRLFGAGAIYMVVDDGDTDQAEELDPAKVRRIESLTVLDRRDLDPASVYDDPAHPKFGQVETYRVNTFGPAGHVSAQIVNIHIHETRLLLFEGARTTNREKQTNGGFTLSILQRVWEVLRQFNISWSALSNMLRAASQGVFKIEGLLEMIAGGQQSVMQTRMALVDLQRSVARSLIIDAEHEDYEQVASNIVGVPDALRVFMLRIASAAKMPLTVLMGMSPAGMNATGESDRLIWAQTVGTDQNRVLRPRLTRLAAIAMESSEGPTGGHVPERWSISFPALIQMTEPERADLRKTTAEADQLHIQNGVLLPEEVAISRYGPDGFSTETIIDVSDRAELLAGDPEPMPAPEPTEPEPAPEPEPEPGEPEPAADPEAVDPKAALSGGQVTSMLAIVDAVIAGTYSKITGARLLQTSLPISIEEADQILADIEEPEPEDDPDDVPEPPGGGVPPAFPPAPTPPPPGTNGPPPPPGAPPAEPPEPPGDIDLDAERADQAQHVHSIPGDGVTGPGAGDPHTHSLPGGGRTGSSNSGAGHRHSLPDGGQTGPPRAVPD